jgi:hypothetical protein
MLTVQLAQSVIPVKEAVANIILCFICYTKQDLQRCIGRERRHDPRSREGDGITRPVDALHFEYGLCGDTQSYLTRKKEEREM